MPGRAAIRILGFSVPRPSFYPLLGPKYILLGTIYPQLRVQGGSWYKVTSLMTVLDLLEPFTGQKWVRRLLQVFERPRYGLGLRLRRLACKNIFIWGFPKIRGTILGVPIIRIKVFGGLYWVPLFWENFHILVSLLLFQVYRIPGPTSLNPKPKALYKP